MKGARRRASGGRRESEVGNRKPEALVLWRRGWMPGSASLRLPTFDVRPTRYSALNALSGVTRVARRAGIQLASTVTPSSSAAITA